ncbi:MAG: flagellar filament capping protein FliD [Armatimonadetes bacterium]|nr:flagellar filament capping protein FliD [Armatimonadota bacterium]
MSLSGISFSGLASGIDAQSIVAQLMQIEAFPINRMQQNQAILQQRLDIYALLRSNLIGLNSSASALNVAATFNPIKTSSSDDEVATVSATSSAAPGTFDLTVSKLAASNKLASTAQSSVDTELGYSGTFIINGRAVDVVSSDTLTQIAQKINSSGATVTASLIDGGAGAAYLTLTAEGSGLFSDIQIANVTGTALSSLGFQTGGTSFRDQVDSDSVRSYGFSSASSTLQTLTGTTATGNFTIGTAVIAVDFSTDSLQTIANSINNDVNSNATAIVVEVEENGKTFQKLEITGNSGLPSITDTDGLLEAIGVYDRADSNELVVAQDAEFTLDGFTLTSYKNAVTDVIPGVTLTLIKADVATPETATLTLTKDVAKISSSFEDLKNSFNDIISFLDTYSQFDDETFRSGPLFGDSIAAQVESRLTSILFDNVGTGDIKNLAQIGFSFDDDGKVDIDTAILEQAISDDPEGVRKLMMAVGETTSNDMLFISSTSKSQAGNYLVDITQVATFGNSVATVAQTGLNIDQETLTFDGDLFGNSSFNLSIPISSTQAQLVAQINADATLKDLVVASVDGSGMLKIESKRYGTAGNFTVFSDKTASADNSGIGLTGGTVTDGLDVAGTIGGLAATGSGQYLTGDEDTDVEGLQIQYTGSSTGAAGTVTLTRGIGAELVYGLETFTDVVSGLLTTTDKAIQGQIDDIADRITQFRANLVLRRGYLERKFLAMETAMAAMQSQMALLATFSTFN